MDKHCKHISWILLAALLVGLLACWQPVSAQSARPPSKGTSTDRAVDLQAVDAFLRENVRANRIPGLAVAIVQGEQVIFEKGYGEARPGEPVTARTQFYIGSVTKSFTSLAVMQLVEQGKLELDAPVQQYLPWFEVADASASARITIRHLLNHTSGLSEGGDPHASAVTASLDEQAHLLKDARLTAPTGTKFQYYNQNYRLLGRVIEQVSGQPFADYLRANILEPLGMAQSTTGPAQAGQLAQGYSRAFGFALPRPQPYNPGGLPSGYVISTAGDMAKFLLAEMNNRQPNGQPLLGEQWLKVMRSTPEGINSEYGMGWLVMENGNMLAHGGSLETYQAFILIRPNEQLGFVMLCNQNSLENMLLENNAIRGGLLNLLNGQPAQQMAYGWVGWVLLVLAAADLLNHLRLFRGLPGWLRKAAGQQPRAAGQQRAWVWVKTAVGILVPAFILFGMPWVAHAVNGSAPTWEVPLSLLPDLVLWLLVGMGLALVRGLLRAFLLLRPPVRTE